MKKFFKMFTLMLFAGALVVGLVSCANNSGNDEPEELLDRNSQPFRHGIYKYDDGYTVTYLYYEYKNLYYAGNKDNEYPESQLKILKKSHSWNNVHQYCSRVDDSACEWLLEKKAFKIGWYRILTEYGQPTECIGYFENRDSCMTWMVTVINGISYRTKQFGDKPYNSMTFNELKELAHPGYSWSIVVGLPYNGSDLDRYPEAPSQSE